MQSIKSLPTVDFHFTLGEPSTPSHAPFPHTSLSAVLFFSLTHDSLRSNHSRQLFYSERLKLEIYFPRGLAGIRSTAQDQPPPILLFRVTCRLDAIIRESMYEIWTVTRDFAHRFRVPRRSDSFARRLYLHTYDSKKSPLQVTYLFLIETVIRKRKKTQGFTKDGGKHHNKHSCKDPWDVGIVYH